MDTLHHRARCSLIGVPPPPARFTIDQWSLNNIQRYRITEDQHQLSDRIIAESGRLIDEGQEVVVKNKREVDHQLEVKIQDIDFRKQQIELQKKDMDIEVDALKTYKERIEDAQQALKTNAENICRKCILLR